MLRRLLAPLAAPPTPWARRFSSVYYDSQSGRMITVPGSSGVRLHAPPAPPGTPAHPRVTSVTHASLALAARAASGAQAPFGPYLAPADAARAAELGVGLELTASCGSARALEHAIRAAQALRVPLRVVLQRCFDARAGGDPDVNLNKAPLEADVALLADLDVQCIVMSDCLARATEEALREALEEAFYLDVAGETVRERLGVRLEGPERLSLLRSALGHGVTRVDCAALADVEGVAGVLPPRV
jgi:hypothetical protein